MKRFYTVKEASEILGFSTNTVYKYLDEGKLKGKRLGRGRFKIPGEELAPFIDVTSLPREERKEAVRGEDISPNAGDAVFSKLFIGITIFALGVIYLFWKLDNNTLLSFLLPAVFIPSGLLAILAIVTPQKVSGYLGLIDIFSLSALGVGIYVALVAASYPSLVVLASLFVIFLIKTAKKMLGKEEKPSFFNDFLFISVVLIIVSGFLALILSDWAKAHRLLFIVTWWGLSIPPLSLFLTRSPKESRLGNIFFPVLGIASFISAVYFSNTSNWDTAFFSFFYSIFVIFFIWWEKSQERIRAASFNTIFLTFIGIAAATLFGIFSIASLQENLKAKAIESMRKSLYQDAADIDYYFSRIHAVVLSAYSKGQGGASGAKAIFDNTPNVSRVGVLSSGGTALGVYPLNSLILGTDLSSEQYFIKAKDSFRAYISPLSQSVFGSGMVVVSEPIFSDNEVGAMVLVGVNLNDLSYKYQNNIEGGSFYAFDENGKYVLNPSIDSIGKSANAQILDSKEDPTFESRDVLRVYDFAKTPRWNLYMEMPTNEVIKSISNTTLMISFLIILNSAFFLAAGFMLAKKETKL